jgi:hypothetical protein
VLILIKLVIRISDVYLAGLKDAERLVLAVNRCCNHLYHLQTQSLVMNLQLQMSRILSHLLNMCLRGYIWPTSYILAVRTVMSALTLVYIIT